MTNIFDNQSFFNNHWPVINEFGLLNFKISFGLAHVINFMPQNENIHLFITVLQMRLFNVIYLGKNSYKSIEVKRPHRA